MYAQTDILTKFTSGVSGTIDSTNQGILLNEAVQDVFGTVNLRTAKRKIAAVPSLFDDVYAHSCPTDLKALGMIDLAPQVNRGRFDDWRLTTVEEFDRTKKDLRMDRLGDPIKLARNSWSGDNMIAISNHDGVRAILASRPIDNDYTVTIDPLCAVGTWTAVGDAETIVADSANFVKGSASVEYNISSAGGTTAGITNSYLAFDITKYLTEGSVFVWAYIPVTTYLTNFILRIGNDSSNYYSITVTTTNESTVFVTGWNLLRFDFANKVVTAGTVTPATCKYASIYMTKNALKVSETGYRFNNLQMKLGVHYDVWYYSKYGWQTNAGVWQLNSTTSTDLLNADDDELALIKVKYQELAEAFLRDENKASLRRNAYEQKKIEYKIANPSEALLLSNTYFQISRY